MDKKKEQKQALIFQELLSAPANKVCCDCGEKGPRWAVWNIGSFVCVNCAGVHRHLGVQTSRVKSVTLDSWTPEQLESMQTKGNAHVNRIYDPHPERHPPCPKGDDSRTEVFLRDKYERKLFADLQLLAAESSFVPIKSQEAHSGQTIFQSLVKMGFKDERKNVEALKMAGGDIDKAVAILVKQAVADANKEPVPKVVQDPIIDFMGQAQIPQKLSNPNPHRSQQSQPAPAPVQPNISSTGHHHHQSHQIPQNHFDGPDLLGPAISEDKAKKDDILALFATPPAGARPGFPPTGMPGRYPQQPGYPQYPQQPGFSPVQPGFPQLSGYPSPGGYPQNYSPQSYSPQMRYPPQVPPQGGYPQMGYPNPGPQYARSNSLI